MFQWLANLAYGRRRLVLVATGLFVGVAGAFGGPVATVLTAGNDSFEDPGAQSVELRERLNAATGGNPEFWVTAVVELEEGVDAAASRRRVEEVTRTLESDPAVARVFSFYNTGSRDFVSDDGDSTYLAVSTKLVSSHEETDAAERIENSFEGQTDVQLGGPTIANFQAGRVVREDLARAELIAFPLILLIALFIFRGVVAALLPLFCGGVLILGTFLALRIANEFLELSIYALNLVTGLGLGLAIDYSLFIVSRYREELARVGPGQEAIARTMATAGRTVLFSALTVGAALASMIVFPQPFLYSMGVGGIFVATMAAATALIALPALLAVLGTRVNALSPERWRRSLDTTPEEQERGLWYRLSHAVIRRRIPVATATIALLFVLGLPALGIEFTGVEASVLPRSTSARQVDDKLKAEFPQERTSPVIVAVSAPPSARGEIEAYAGRLGALPAASTVTEPQAVGGDTWRIDVIPADAPLAGSSQDLVDAIRGIDTDNEVLVGGQTAAFVDQKSSVGDRLPAALTILGLATVLILFAMTGSVILPIKSLVMNAVTLMATFGILVFIFQDGRLEGLLDYTSQGALEITQPIVLAATAFGLSTDYGVFLLTRIKEARDSGESDTEAIAIGLERTGRIVTAAALLFAIAVAAFATSGIVFIKMLGIGIALAVLIDATVIRALLVPSLMALLGARNWWAPGPLKRLHERLGLAETETPRPAPTTN